MLGRLRHKAIYWVFFAILLSMSGIAGAATMTADQYLGLKQSVGATSPTLTDLKTQIAKYAGHTIELTGIVNGIVMCGQSTTFIVNCSGESVPIRTTTSLADCIMNGNTVRILAKLGPGCTVSLSDLQLIGVAYDYDVTERLKQLAPKVAVPTPKPEVITRDSNYASATMGRGDRLSSRCMSIYEPYRKAIAGFNPRLTKEEVNEITAGVLMFSEKYNVDPRLVVALILTESGFNPNATSRCGAMGLGQLMPGTAQGLGVSNAYDPVQNLEASIRLIRGHLSKYGDLALALSAYNAGPGAVKKYGGVPPYRETQNYVRKISSLYNSLCGK